MANMTMAFFNIKLNTFVEICKYKTMIKNNISFHDFGQKFTGKRKINQFIQVWVLTFITNQNKNTMFVVVYLLMFQFDIAN